MGTRLIERVMETGSLVIGKLGCDRAGEIAIHRFLSAASVTCGEMVATLATRTGDCRKIGGRNQFRALNGVVPNVCRDCLVADNGQHQLCFQ